MRLPAHSDDRRFAHFMAGRTAVSAVGKKLRPWAVAASLLVGGCATAPPITSSEPLETGTVRWFNGQRVVGQTVSPSAYQSFVEAELATLSGRGEDAVQALARAIASDGVSAYLRTRLGDELAALGRIDEARESYESAVRFDPTFAEAHLGLGRIALRLGDAAAAEASWKRAVDGDRGCEEAWLALANLYRDRGDNARAEATYRELVAAAPRSARARLQLARAAVARGDSKVAETELRHALDLNPSSIEARLDLGRLLFSGNRTVEAEKELRVGYELCSHDPRIAELLIQVEVAAGDPDAADAILDALDSAGGPRDRRMAVGWLRLSRNRADRAAAIADEVLQLGELPAARLLLGTALADQGRNADAIAELRKVGDGEAEYSRAQYRIGRILSDEGRLQEASEQLGLAMARLQGKPDADAFSTLLAQVKERSGDRAQGQKLLEKALLGHPDSDLLAFALGGMLERGGEWDRAIEVVRGVLKRSPDNADALNFVGFLWADHGVRLGEAQKLLERALSLRPTSGQMADSLGWLYLKIGRLDDAARLLERAERLLPTSAEVLRHVGDLYSKRADRESALVAYRKALANHPDEKLRQAVEERLLLLEPGRVGAR